MQLIRLIASICLLTFTNMYLTAQQSIGGLPISSNYEHLSAFANNPAKSFQLNSLDRGKLKQEDDALNLQARFAAPVEISLGLEQKEYWTTLDNGDRVWRATLEISEALGTYIAYKDFFLPEGAKLWMYSSDLKQVKGAYTSRNNTKAGDFLTGEITGNNVVVEYYEPKEQAGQGSFTIHKVYEVYKRKMGKRSNHPFQVYEGFGDALNCHVNVNCAAGANWQDEKKGVVRILRVFDQGMGYCSGTLINNVNEDETPYVLSAYHCIDGLDPIYNLWRFTFKYESENCSNPAQAPIEYPLLGCQFRSGRQQSDFLLLELDTPIPSGYEPYFLGWDRSSTALPTTSTIISHPQGDIKKIAADNDAAVIHPSTITWSNGVVTPPNHHFLLDLDEGTLENGSSGSALLDQNSRIVGQLHGGNSDCSQFINYFGRFSISWDAGTTPETRLMDWLDPNNTGATTIDAFDPPTPQMASISGQLKSAIGAPLPNVDVVLSGDASQTVTTDAQGIYSFSNLTVGGNYTVDPVKDTNLRNGLNAIDVILTARDVLLIEALPPLAKTAGNVATASGLNITDIIVNRRLQLFFIQDFPDVDSWEFVPNEITITNLSGDVINQDYIGLKMGDVDFSADPNQ